MHANTGSKCGNEQTAVNPVLGSLKSGQSVPAALGALFDARTSSDAFRAQDGLREAVQEMFHAISNLLNEELESAQASLQRAALALRLAPCSAELGAVVQRKSQQIIRGGLAPWQARVLKTHIETHLDVSLRTKELAKLVQLSSFHFCRVFRVSFGNSPHGYVTRVGESSELKDSFSRQNCRSVKLPSIAALLIRPISQNYSGDLQAKAQENGDVCVQKPPQKAIQVVTR